MSLRTVAEALVARANLANNPAPAASKMRNLKTVVDGITFASKWEAHRYTELKLMQMGGIVKELELQVVMPLIVNNVKVCEYVADFVYLESVPHREAEEWRLVVEDAKGFRTDVYQLKKKLLFACRGIEVRETRKRIRSTR